MSPVRIRKSGQRLVADLESQIKFLREAIQALAEESDRYKQIAATLRVLVCSFGKNRPLLLDLMDELDAVYFISPIPDLPFPIPLVDDSDKDDLLDLGEMSSDDIWQYYRSIAKSYSLREFVRRAEAIHFMGHSYSYQDLIRTLAEQSGLGHEDWKIDQNVPGMESFVIGGVQSHMAPLLNLCEHVLSAATNVVNFASDQGYRPHYFVLRDEYYQLPHLFAED
ncbi:MAG: hypothetical protein DWQ47_04115 [Acidobacteria bacterium]|nr:MAG: hypothetical protein DWQ32_07665 [Acidobacteriota bacterium]REK01581.1 MAG: hypothetical protein DWQ38_04100 [Acidobacteriota bacterium]REK14537.1 MAG: hypothetical protein DWQ43_13355 [Acidobacteriota bacterium]REK45252.1 MAG: hypothetical protein DWQ47_04115 [Acidobacteriota bacterium]